MASFDTSLACWALDLPRLLGDECQLPDTTLLVVSRPAEDAQFIQRAVRRGLAMPGGVDEPSHRTILAGSGSSNHRGCDQT